jgi:hypothetical protein
VSRPKSHERRVVARPVHGLLDREHVGIRDGLVDEALDRRREGVVRVVEQDVAAAHRGQQVGLLVVVALQPRLGDGRPRRVAQLGVAGHADDVPQVLEVEQAGDVEHVLVLDHQRAGDLLADRRAHVRAHLDPHDVAEAAPAQLVLDRLEQVVGLVGDREVGVARDAEDVVVDDLHAREQRVQVLGDQVLERDERVAVAGRHEAGQHLLRHLHAREGLDAGHRVAHQHAERQRQVGDVGERPAEPDGQRREDREDLAAEALVQRAALLGVDVVDADDADPVLAQRRPQRQLQAAALALDVLADDAPRLLQRGARRAAVLERRLDARLDLVVQARDADHEELVEVGGHDRAELRALQQRHAVVLGELEHALVELQPGQLAVEVQLGGGEVRLGGDALGAGVAHNGDCDRSETANASRASKPLRS